MTQIENVLGPAVGSAAVMSGLLVLLVERGIVSKEDVVTILDGSLHSLEQAQAAALPEHTTIWETARTYVQILIDTA